MGTVKILESASAVRRLEAAAGFVESFEPATELLLVGAAREAADDFAREVSIRRGATFGLHRFSLTQLAARLALGELAEQGAAPATSLAAEALAARATFEVLEGERLEYFAPVARSPGFARSLASTVHDLRTSGVQPASLSGLERVGRDLQKLADRFDRQLTESSLADRAALFRAAMEALRNEQAPFFAAWPVLLLDVPIESAAERDFVRLVAEAASEVLATVPAGDAPSRAALESIPGCRLHTDGPAPAPQALVRLQTFLFSLTEPAAGETAQDPQEVVFFSAPGEGRECVEIARRILEEGRRGVPFDRICILLRAPELYSGLLESALRRAGVPMYFARGTTVPDPSGRAFLALLACAVERLSARRFAEYLSLGQVPQLDESGRPPRDRDVWVAAEDETLGVAGAPAEGAPPPRAASGTAPSPGERKTGESPVVSGTLRAPWNWEHLIVEAAVIGGQDRWKRRLDGLAGELRVKLAELEGEEPDSARARAVARDLENLSHLRAFAVPVIEELAAFPATAPWGTWLQHLERLAPMVLRRPERVLSVLAEMRPMAAVGPVPLEEVCDVLAERLTLVEEPPPARRFGRVFVSTPDQIRGRSFEVLFVPGLAERIFPQKPREDPLLLDTFRVQLGPDLETQDRRADRERLRLRLAVGAAASRVCLSYPRMELNESRPRVPSFYALDVQRAITGRVPDHKQLEQQAFKVAEARLAWPAPPSPALAIDEMEHALAVLGPLLRHPRPSEVKGRARYLLELSPELGRSLRTRHARWHMKKWSGFDGLCQPSEGVREALAGHRLRARPYSVSALQKFAVCPYQFLLSGIYRLEPREEPAPLEQMDPLTRGHLFHRVQADLMRELKRRKALPVRLDNLTGVTPVLDETLDHVAVEYREKLAPAIERVWDDEVESIRADLRGWLAHAAMSGGEWEPTRFEFGFGFKAQRDMDPESRLEPVILEGGWKLHGIIDLIERRRGGSELRVTDHKTGKNRTEEGMVVGRGEVLQPVLYGLSAEAALGQPVVESRLYYCTSTGGFTERTVPMNKPARQWGIQVLEIVDRAIENSFLPPAPRERACEWCDFREVCGPNEERRASRKESGPLDDLMKLRCLP